MPRLLPTPSAPPSKHKSVAGQQQQQQQHRRQQGENPKLHRHPSSTTRPSTTTSTESPSSLLSASPSLPSSSSIRPSSPKAQQQHRILGRCNNDDNDKVVSGSRGICHRDGVCGDNADNNAPDKNDTTGQEHENRHLLLPQHRRRRRPDGSSFSSSSSSSTPTDMMQQQQQQQNSRRQHQSTSPSVATTKMITPPPRRPALANDVRRNYYARRAVVGEQSHALGGGDVSRQQPMSDPPQSKAGKHGLPDAMQHAGDPRHQQLQQQHPGRFSTSEGVHYHAPLAPTTPSVVVVDRKKAVRNQTQQQHQHQQPLYSDPSSTTLPLQHQHQDIVVVDGRYTPVVFSDPYEMGSVSTGLSQQELLRRRARESSNNNKKRKQQQQQQHRGDGSGTISTGGRASSDSSSIGDGNGVGSNGNKNSINASAGASSAPNKNNNPSPKKEFRFIGLPTGLLHRRGGGGGGGVGDDVKHRPMPNDKQRQPKSPSSGATTGSSKSLSGGGGSSSWNLDVMKKKMMTGAGGHAYGGIHEEQMELSTAESTRTDEQHEDYDGDPATGGGMKHSYRKKLLPRSIPSSSSPTSSSTTSSSSSFSPNPLSPTNRRTISYRRRYPLPVGTVGGIVTSTRRRQQQQQQEQHLFSLPYSTMPNISSVIRDTEDHLDVDSGVGKAIVTPTATTSVRTDDREHCGLNTSSSSDGSKAKSKTANIWAPKSNNNNGVVANVQCEHDNGDDNSEPPSLSLSLAADRRLRDQGGGQQCLLQDSHHELAFQQPNNDGGVDVGIDDDDVDVQTQSETVASEFSFPLLSTNARGGGGENSVVDSGVRIAMTGGVKTDVASPQPLLPPRQQSHQTTQDVEDEMTLPKKPTGVTTERRHTTGRDGDQTSTAVVDPTAKQQPPTRKLLADNGETETVGSGSSSSSLQQSLRTRLQRERERSRRYQGGSSGSASGSISSRSEGSRCSNYGSTTSASKRSSGRLGSRVDVDDVSGNSSGRNNHGGVKVSFSEHSPPRPRRLASTKPSESDVGSVDRPWDESPSPVNEQPSSSLTTASPGERRMVCSSDNVEGNALLEENNEDVRCYLAMNSAARENGTMEDMPPSNPSSSRVKIFQQPEDHDGEESNTSTSNASGSYSRPAGSRRKKPKSILRQQPRFSGKIVDPSRGVGNRNYRWIPSDTTAAAAAAAAASVDPPGWGGPSSLLHLQSPPPATNRDSAVSITRWVHFVDQSSAATLAAAAEAAGVSPLSPKASGGRTVTFVDENGRALSPIPPSEATSTSTSDSGIVDESSTSSSYSTTSWIREEDAFREDAEEGEEVEYKPQQSPSEVGDHQRAFSSSPASENETGEDGLRRGEQTSLLLKADVDVLRGREAQEVNPPTKEASSRQSKGMDQYRVASQGHQPKKLRQSGFIRTVGAIVIQTAFRRYLAIEHVRSLREHIVHNRHDDNNHDYVQQNGDENDVSEDGMDLFDVAAMQIQAAFRGFWTRDCLNVDQYCATIIQKAFRGYICRMKYDHQVLIEQQQQPIEEHVLEASHQDRDQALEVSQPGNQQKLRSRTSTRITVTDGKSHEHQTSIVTMTGTDESDTTGNGGCDMFNHQDAAAAAVRIQSVWRGFVDREIAAYRLGCLIVIQSIYRGYRIRSLMEKLWELVLAEEGGGGRGGGVPAQNDNRGGHVAAHYQPLSYGTGVKQPMGKKAQISKKDAPYWEEDMKRLSQQQPTLHQLPAPSSSSMQPFQLSTTLKPHLARERQVWPTTSSRPLYDRVAKTMRDKQRHLQERRPSDPIADNAATIIQTAWRCFICRQYYFCILVDVMVVQTIARKWLASRKLHDLRRRRSTAASTGKAPHAQWVATKQWKHPNISGTATECSSATGTSDDEDDTSRGVHYRPISDHDEEASKSQASLLSLWRDRERNNNKPHRINEYNRR